MFDIGFWELLVIAVVLLLVLGPERLPEFAKQAAFWVRKVRTGMHRLRSEMKNEMEGTPFADLQKAKAEVRNFKNDMQQFGRDLADSANETIASSDASKSDTSGRVDTPNTSDQKPRTSSVKRVSKKKTTKQASISKAGKKSSNRKVAKKTVRKKTTRKKTDKKTARKPGN